MAEIRSVAPDTAWLCPSRGRACMALHFTWRRLPEDVNDVLPMLEAALLPLGARPHWRKVIVCDRVALPAAYLRLDDFATR
jgi:xylitol oxidase